MQSVLISIRPEWCEKIVNGQKTVEVRKSRPKQETPFKCYIYETKDEYVNSDGNKQLGRGKVIGEFVCDTVDEFMVFENGSVQHWNYADLEKSCLSYDEIAEYVGKDKYGYAWHISDLVIYDVPKELKKFGKKQTEEAMAKKWSCTFCGECDWFDYPDRPFIEPGTCFAPWNICPLRKAPQSWCYVDSIDEEKEKFYGKSKV